MPDAKSRKCDVTAFREKIKQFLCRYYKLFLAYFIISAILAVAIVASAYLRSCFIDTMFQKGHSTQSILLLLVLNVLIIFCIRYGLPAIRDCFEKNVVKHILCDIESSIGERKCAILWFYHEDPEIHNEEELLKEVPGHVWTYFKSYISIVSLIISTTGMFLLMMQLGMFFVMILFLLFIPVTYFSVKAASSYYGTWQRTAPLRRYCNYQRDILIDKEHATERILFEFTPFFLKRWEKDYEQVRHLSICEELKGSKKMQVGGILYCLYIAFLLVFIGKELEAGHITVGYAVSLISIFPALMNNAIVVLSNEINQLSKATHAIKTLIKFEDLECEEGYFDHPEEGATFSKIEFKQVYFKYPNTTNWILKDINMCLVNGKHYAIVGENGAGKSTLIKLLLRLYKVTKGEILIDGVNINNVSRAKLLGLVSALFQDYQRYYTTISENVGIGDINHVQEMTRIIESAQKAGLHKQISQLSAGYDTVLGTMHKKGIDLSGGEWQRLALSRLIMSSSPIKILDEPTASMDPIYEYELYRDFTNIMEENTTITISHRFASCKNADYIYVLDEGNIIEQGLHEELISKQNKYYEMYMAQKKMYQ